MDDAEFVVWGSLCPGHYVMAELLPLERQWLLLRRLTARGGGSTVKELAVEFNVSEKTIQRDINLFRKVGFRCESTNRPHGEKAWQLDSDSILAGVSFTLEEVAALYLGRRFLEPLAGTYVWDGAQKAFQKIRSGLGEAALRHLERMSETFHQTESRLSDYSQRARLIDDLTVAIEDCRITHITYHSASSTEPITYDVYPYGLIYHRSSLYLVAMSNQHDELRTFKIDRLHGVSLETLKFPGPADFDLRSYLQHSLGVFHGEGPPQRVVIRFDKQVARYIQEHRWHPSQTLALQRDGSIRVDLQLSDLHEVKAWVLSFGAKARVEEPEELREMIYEDVQSLLAQFEVSR